METESYIYPTQAELLNEIVEGDLYTDIHLEEKISIMVSQNINVIMISNRIKRGKFLGKNLIIILNH